MSLAIYPLTVRGLTFPVMKSSEFSTIVQPSPNEYEVRVPNTWNPVWHWSLIYDYLKDSSTDILASLSPYSDYRYMLGFLMSNQGQNASFLFNDLEDNTVGPATWQTPVVAPLVNYFATGATIIDPAGHLQTATRGGLSGATIPTFNDSGGTTTDGGILWQDGGAISGTLGQTLPVVTDGTFYYTPLQRNMGGQFLEDVTDLNTTNYPLRLWANGTLKTSGTDYTLLGPGAAIGGTPGYSYMGMYVKWASSPALPVTASFSFYFRARLEQDKQDLERFLNHVWTIGGSASRNGSGQLMLRTARPQAL